MSLTAKRILFIGENSMGFHQIMTDSKKACQELTECAKIFYDYPSASIISEEELFGYTLKVAYESSKNEGTIKEVAMGVWGFRNFLGEYHNLTAPVSIIFVVMVGEQIMGMGEPWDISPEKFDELSNQDTHAFGLVGLEVLVAKLREGNSLETIAKMQECRAKQEMQKIASNLGWSLGKD